jgi:hypothetical protein
MIHIINVLINRRIKKVLSVTLRNIKLIIATMLFITYLKYLRVQ